MRKTLFIGLLIVLIGGTLATVQARPLASQYFPQTGFTIPEPILSAYNQFGGVPLMGLPISAAMETTCEGTPCTVQWMERSRVEVLVTGEIYRGRIGADYLAGRGTPWAFGDGSTPDGCQAVPETGHAICEPFLSAWRQFGGTERLGLPISGVQEETYVDAGTGQTVTFPTLWLERGALEAQPDGVKLRLLGSQTYPTWAERLLADLINAERQQAGLNTLEWHDGLAEVARAHSEDAARNNFESHISSDGRRPLDRLTPLGLPGSYAGEIISFHLTPTNSIVGFMGSDGHRQALLNPEMTHLGVGYSVVLGPVKPDNGPATVWTVDFWHMP